MEKTIKIINKTGLHARPVTHFVNACKAYDAEIYLQKGDRKVKGDSIISIMSLGVGYEDELTVSASGQQAEKAVEELAAYLANFEE
ncbi:HPr family phosphocarrier protein [Acidaminobacter sp. JC074]|uniref:HPr family phosphocarrier protein n=1 Tax=Acidaminobacter sp. JC074 TaxID=2530199 RepID=UPI001F0DB7FD|nr:HPr family phosphocarrier protein [Acidaminobacter sp. JC074]MCH4886447.1 HPr family phosphocarrier protein [Acidaminobacter sp. JC074]